MIVSSPEKVVVKYLDQSGGYNYVYSILNKADGIDISDVTTVNAVCFNVFSSQFPQQMIGYNKTHHDIRVTGEDYSVYNETDSTAATMKLISEMLTGIYTPDIICLPCGMQNIYNDIAAKIIENGLYTDMYDFISDDSDIKKDGIMGVVKNTYEDGGALVGVMPIFSVKTIIALKSEVGDKVKWNYDGLFDFIDNLPKERSSPTTLRPNWSFTMRSLSLSTTKTKTVISTIPPALR